MPYTDFHYTPTGTGVISGKEVLEQTEDAINDLGTQISGDVQTAIDTANNALNTANTASADAQNAVNTANTAYTTATNAQNTANTAQNTASNALTAAQNAQNDVNALGNRVTTAENNITQNTNAITGLTTRMRTAEGNITTLQNNVVTAQGTATSAQNTATLARGQAYVVRYASVAVSDNSTVPYTDLNNVDNIKANDLLLDTNGKLYQISSVDTANETVSVTTPLTQLAVDSDVVHKSGDESVTGSKRFGVVQRFTGYPSIRLYSADDDITVLPSYARQQDIRFTDKNNAIIAYFIFQHRNDANEPFRTCWRQNRLDGTDNYYSVNFNNLGQFYPENNNAINLGRNNNRWKSVYATNYYYGSNNVEFSTKFVTTDTAQTISETKTFTKNVNVKNEDVTRGSVTGNGAKSIPFTDSNSNELGSISVTKVSNGSTSLSFKVSTTDNTDTVISSSFQLFITKTGSKVINPSVDGDIALGRLSNRWSDVQTYKVNALEPSSLSLPSGNVSDVIDISSYLVNLDGTDNTYVAPANGWITINMNNCSGIHATITGFWGDSRVRASAGAIKFLMPVLKNQTATIFVFGGTIDNARFIPCQGNV